MTYLPWDPKLETGDPMIDAQHQSLFALVNELHTSIVDHDATAGTENSISRLIHYVNTHFDAEEAYMERHGYPRLGEHHLLHLRLRRETESLASRYLEGNGILPLTISMFLYDWLTHHVAEEDQQMVAWVKANGLELAQVDPSDPWRES